jgi:hypothetical protein
MAVVTFDFDDTLTQTQWDNDEECFIFVGPNHQMCNVLREHVQNGDDVHIVTSRTGPSMSIEGILAAHGQPSIRMFLQEHMGDVIEQLAGVHFTGGLKRDMLVHLGSTKHFDDDCVELNGLPDTCAGILVQTLHGLE